MAPIPTSFRAVCKVSAITWVPASSAIRLFDVFDVADKELRICDDETGGSGHCGVDNWTQVVAYQIDWLLDRLG